MSMLDMDLGTVNWLAVVVSTIAAFVVGAIWFGPKTFYPIWWKAIGRSPEDKPEGSGSMAVTFGLIGVAAFVQAVVLALIIGVLRSSGTDVGLVLGAVTGLIVGVGFSATTSLGHRLMGGQGFVVWAIEVGGDIAALAVMGGILGAWQ